MASEFLAIHNLYCRGKVDTTHGYVDIVNLAVDVYFFRRRIVAYVDVVDFHVVINDVYFL